MLSFSCSNYPPNDVNQIFYSSNFPAAGRRQTVLLDGERAGGGRQAVVRAGDDHEEAVARPRGPGR